MRRIEPVEAVKRAVAGTVYTCTGFAIRIYCVGPVLKTNKRNGEMIMTMKKEYTAKEIKAFVRQEYREYLRTIGELTDEEKKDLREWVADGNSVQENPYLLYGENGWPMDFITGCRIGDDMRENPQNYQWSDLPAGQEPESDDIF